MSTQSMLKGLPFKFGSDVRIEGNTNIPDLNCLNSITNKIKNFDFDTFEYDFKLENDVLEEYASKIEYTIQENANDNEENEEETESS